MEIEIYVDPHGRELFTAWYARLRDLRGQAAIERRLERFRDGHPGDTKYCRGGVWEMRFAPGPGYRVYFGRDGGRIVVLLGGGDKASQKRDLDRAVAAWQDYVERTK